MKMNKTKDAMLHLLSALTFSTASLAAVHMLTFVWLTAFVYHDNIRGYVPAGITGLLVLGICSLLLLFHLAAVARRRRDRSAPYLLGGCLAVPAAVLGSSLYVGTLIALLGCGWQKDVAISSSGGILCTLMAVVFHRLWLSKKADNQRPDFTARRLAEKSA